MYKPVRAKISSYHTIRAKRKLKRCWTNFPFCIWNWLSKQWSLLVRMTQRNQGIPSERKAKLFWNPKLLILSLLENDSSLTDSSQVNGGLTIDYLWLSDLGTVWQRASDFLPTIYQWLCQGLWWNLSGYWQLYLAPSRKDLFSLMINSKLCTQLLLCNKSPTMLHREDNPQKYCHLLGIP